jgi:hypothetical protein
MSNLNSSHHFRGCPVFALQRFFRTHRIFFAGFAVAAAIYLAVFVTVFRNAHGRPPESAERYTQYGVSKWDESFRPGSTRAVVPPAGAPPAPTVAPANSVAVAEPTPIELAAAPIRSRSVEASAPTSPPPQTNPAPAPEPQPAPAPPPPQPEPAPEPPVENSPPSDDNLLMVALPLLR